MGKYAITHLKAPWPSGAKVGDVIEFDHVPSWALGKCEPAAEDADVFAPADQVDEPLIVANIEPVVAQEVAESATESQPDADAGRKAMEVEAKVLGVPFNSRTTDETLAERIAEAKAKAKVE